jgi:hypothetical protein
LVSDADRFTGLAESRGGQADAVEFSTESSSYRYIFLSALAGEEPDFEGFHIGVGAAGEKRTKVYRDLVFARNKNLQTRGITERFALVEVEVNSGLGSSGDDQFVATNIRVLDGGTAYPLRVVDVVADLQQRYDAHRREQEVKIQDAMADVRRRTIKDAQTNGHPTDITLMYLTWLPTTEHLQVRFRTELTDGATFRGQHPGGSSMHPILGALAQGSGILGAAAHISQTHHAPRRIIQSFQVEFGVQLGMTYEVSKTGKLEECKELPLLAFWRYW